MVTCKIRSCNIENWNSFFCPFPVWQFALSISFIFLCENSKTHFFLSVDYALCDQPDIYFPVVVDTRVQMQLIDVQVIVISLIETHTSYTCTQNNVSLAWYPFSV